MARRPSLRLLALLFVPLALLLADFVAWRIATHRLATAFLTWQAGLGAQGWQLTSDPPAATGWPVSATLHLTRMRLAESSGGFGWTADAVDFGTSLLRPREVSILPSGDQAILLPGWAPVRFHANRLVATAPLGAPVDHAGAEASTLAVETRWGELVADQASIATSWNTDAAEIRIAFTGIALPPGHGWGLGDKVAETRLELRTHGAWPAGTSRAAATAWRDHGGTLQIGAAALRWGQLAIDGSGQLALDGSLQPTGRMNLSITDAADALATLADAGVIGRGVATAAGAVLTLLSVPDRLAGGGGTLHLPLHLDAGAIALGAIPLAKVPPMQWQ